MAALNGRGLTGCAASAWSLEATKRGYNPWAAVVEMLGLSAGTGSVTAFGNVRPAVSGSCWDARIWAEEKGRFERGAGG
ncbi:MAG: hypothetical protein JRN16_08645 [Nitrososphaerota archaeon]|nr:hypothetical protein [Nitrososphaerota archaeon]MDG6959233.1 hypothetical protein [Nitrososphaerota archaeon]MDG6969082.1 hypothetical protein [Nitrososphaerota archaeon]MDG6972037.1 hypothetical protein [Nitrososphaerota archaeon]MDG6976252.1 hypothetical protein [Nitrososphaerota archaeon]